MQGQCQPYVLVINVKIRMLIDAASWRKTPGRLFRCRWSYLCKRAGERDQAASLLAR